MTIHTIDHVLIMCMFTLTIDTWPFWFTQKHKKKVSVEQEAIGQSSFNLKASLPV